MPLSCADKSGCAPRRPLEGAGAVLTVLLPFAGPHHVCHRCTVGLVGGARHALSGCGISIIRCASITKRRACFGFRAFTQETGCRKHGGHPVTTGDPPVSSGIGIRYPVGASFLIRATDLWRRYL